MDNRALASLIIPFTGQDIDKLNSFLAKRDPDFLYLDFDGKSIELFTNGDPENLSTLYDTFPLTEKSDAVKFSERVAEFADGKTMDELADYLNLHPKAAAKCIVLLMQVAGAFERVEA